MRFGQIAANYYCVFVCIFLLVPRVAHTLVAVRGAIAWGGAVLWTVRQPALRTYVSRLTRIALLTELFLTPIRMRRRTMSPESIHANTV